MSLFLLNLADVTFDWPIYINNLLLCVGIVCSPSHDPGVESCRLVLVRVFFWLSNGGLKAKPRRTVITYSLISPLSISPPTSSSSYFPHALFYHFPLFRCSMSNRSLINLIMPRLSAPLIMNPSAHFTCSSLSFYPLPISSFLLSTIPKHF